MEPWNVHAYWLAAGALRQLQDQLLRKRKKENRAAGALAGTHNPVQCLQPAHTVLCLVLCPDADESESRFHLVPAPFLVTAACAVCLVHGKQLLPTQLLVGTLTYRFPFRLRLLQLFFE